MRSDAKLGLALGMLVIGFAVAFCFPRQPEMSLWGVVPNEPIEEPEFDFLPIRAYQPVRENREVPTTVPPSPGEHALAMPVTERTYGSEPDARPVAPIRPGVRTLSEVLSLDLKVERAESTTEPSVLSAPERIPETSEPGGDRPSIPTTYRVRKGDTLTGIATRLLGNSQRYRDIYEANRDRLSSPDALRVGMDLRIPVPEPSPVAANPATDDDFPPGEDALEVGPGESRRFRQADRAPFLSDGSRE